MATVHTNLTVGKTYAVTSADGCTVTLANGVEVELQAGQDYFTPDTPVVTVSDDTATVVQVFNHAPARRGGGGSITIDPAPTQGSENAVSSGGVYTALRELPAPTPEALMTHAKATWDISPELPYIALYVQVANAAGDILLSGAFGGADTPEELAEELNAIEGMSDLLVWSSEGNKLIATAVAAGEAGNGMQFSLTSTQPPYPEFTITLSGGGIASGSLKHQHVYTLGVAADTDLSALTVAQYATCELWLDYTAGSVTWPTGLWWADGSAPTLAAGKSYAIALRNDGVKLRANVQYEDDTPAQS